MTRGQSVEPGEVIASIAREGGRFSVLVLLPGQQRPALREGQPLRLELVGYQYVYQTMMIERVDEGVIGPHEVRRVLGPEVADSIPVDGPVGVVHATLPDATFVWGGDVYRYFDGMHATARVRVRTERLLTMLVPGIKLVTEPQR